MLWKIPIKNPVFSIGILMLVLVLFDLSRRGILPRFSEQVISKSCISANVMLKKRIPGTWFSECEDNNMVVTIHTQQKVVKKTDLSKVLYRELANHLQFIAKNTLNESLERTLTVRVHLIHPEMKINALTEGKYLAKLATIERPEFIAQHLKATVMVQEEQAPSVSP